MTHAMRPAALACLLFAALAGCGAAPATSPNAMLTDPMAATDADGGIWRGLARHEIQLGQKLLVVRGAKGVVGCPYLDVRMFEKAGEACAIVPAADTQGMLGSRVIAVTSKAKDLGITVGMSGREALERIR